MNTFIHIAVVVVFVSGCGSRQSAPTPTPTPSASAPLERTAENFQAITTNMIFQQVIDRFGIYDRVRGSGMLYYQYDLPDGTAVLVSVEPPFQPTNRIWGVGFYRSSNEIPLHP